MHTFHEGVRGCWLQVPGAHTHTLKTNSDSCPHIHGLYDAIPTESRPTPSRPSTNTSTTQHSTAPVSVVSKKGPHPPPTQSHTAPSRPSSFHTHQHQHLSPLLGLAFRVALSISFPLLALAFALHGGCGGRRVELLLRVWFGLGHFGALHQTRRHVLVMRGGRKGGGG